MQGAALLGLDATGITEETDPVDSQAHLMSQIDMLGKTLAEESAKRERIESKVSIVS